MVLGYATAQKFFFQHFKNGRLAAAANASQYLDKRFINKRLDSFNIVRSVNHDIASPIAISITRKIRICNEFFWSNRKNFISIQRRYDLSFRLRSLLSKGTRFGFQLCAVFFKGITLVAIHIKIIIALCRRTAQHIHILLAFHQKRAGWKNSIFDGAASLIVSAASFHGVKVPQRGIWLFSQPIHGAVNICLELRCVQHIILVRPPSRKKLLAAAKVAAQMSDIASDLVLLLSLGVTEVMQRSVIGYKKVDDLFLADGIFLLKLCQRETAGFEIQITVVQFQTAADG